MTTTNPVDLDFEGFIILNQFVVDNVTNCYRFRGLPCFKCDVYVLVSGAVLRRSGNVLYLTPVIKQKT